MLAFVIKQLTNRMMITKQKPVWLLIHLVVSQYSTGKDKTTGLLASLYSTATTCWFCFQLSSLCQFHRLAEPDIKARHALVASRLDYCNALLAGPPESTRGSCFRVFGIRPSKRVYCRRINWKKRRNFGRKTRTVQFKTQFRIMHQKST